METAFLVRVPHKPAQFLHKIRRIETVLAGELGREPTDEEVAARMEQSVEDVRETIANIHSTISLDDIIDIEHDFSLKEKIAAVEPTGDEHLRKREIRERLRVALKRLNEKEEQVLRLRFGVGNDTGLTLKEIGEKLNLSRERIRQIEAQALQKLHDTDYNEELAELNDAL